MKNKSYYRLFLSYFPIFFVLTSVLILLTFILLSQASRTETKNANRIYVRHVIQLIDHTLKEIDGMLIQEISTDEKLQDFFRGTGADLSHFDLYEVSQEITRMTTFNRFMDSVYLYRHTDGMVLSPNMYVPVETFGDRDFIGNHMKTLSFRQLSPKREYLEIPGQDRFPATVVSLVRKYPLLENGRGLVVVNLSVSEISGMLKELSDSDVSFLEIRDESGNVILGDASSSDGKRTVLSEIKSDYTGWTYTSGVYDKKLFLFVSVFSYIWVAVGFLVVVTGTIWMAYVTRRNYKPIASLMDRISRYSKQRAEELSRGGGDEFQFIEQAIEGLIEEASVYQKMQKEDSEFRRRHFFMEWMEGSRPVRQEEWRKELARFGMPTEAETLGLAVYEMDRSAELADRYSYRDLYLLKFVLNSVIKETADSGGARVWTEWTGPHQLAALYFLPGALAEGEDKLAALAEQVRVWTETNLDFTVTVGIGSCLDEVEALPYSYSQALEALADKPSVGRNRVMKSSESRSGDDLNESNSNIPPGDFRPLAKAYRSGSEEWRRMYTAIFNEWKKKRYPREEQVRLMNAMVQCIQAELAEFPEPLRLQWRETALLRIVRVRDTFDLTEEAEERILTALDEFGRELEAYRSSRGHLAKMRELRSYIEKEFANPDLSLNLLCEVSGLNGKYLSRLFKEAFGEKLVDYMTRVRLDESKRLLESTPLTLQQIANRVGYRHDISYIRVFKKVEGMTPGDYRKTHGSSA